MKKTELLIPVGNKECLLAAIHNGADAVYLGGKKFGARAYSNNFDEQEMIEAIKLCHLYGVKIYVTVNTMIYNSEIEQVMNYLNFLYINNVDAVIMQDNGLIELTRKTIPNLEIHVSTQAHNHNKPAIEHYKQLGCTRVVFDRESSLESIYKLDVDIEKEVFVYGALCICYSGNCLMSSLNGGRSANRGMCVGSCRLPYTLYKNDIKQKEGYLLSTKDLNTLPKLKEILDCNIDSLKIEGRMKSKEYVAIVTKTYRKLIDNYYEGKELLLTKEDNEKLLKTYNREFTTGYLFEEKNIINDKTSNHQGVKIGKVIGVNNKRITIELESNLYQNDAIRFDKPNKGMYVNSLYNNKGLLVSNISKGNICQVDNKDRIMIKDLLGSNVLKTIDTKLNEELNNIQEKKILVNISFKAFIGTKATLSITDNTNTIEITGNIVDKALNAPITKERIIEQLSKLGNTPYKLNNIDIEIDNNIFINLKELNELRRNATEQLTIKREGTPISDKQLTIKEYPYKTATKPKISILTRNEDQLKLAISNNIDIIYTTDKNLYNKYKDKNIYLRLDRVIEKHEDYNNENLLCTEFGSIVKYGNNNNIRTDYYLNAANDHTISKYLSLNSKSVTISIEADNLQINDIKNKEQSEIIVYGYPECMIIKNNIFNIRDEKTYLKDIKNNKYLVVYDNFTHIFNYEPINLIDRIPKLKGFGTLRIELLNENIGEVQTIINKIKNML
ncbi:MAG: U32 family peptidase [Firmicutes bacterium]|nr:U32 family peptidase [Bacillota bacterium]